MVSKIIIFVLTVAVATSASASQLPLAQKDQMAGQQNVTQSRGGRGDYGNCNNYQAGLINIAAGLNIIVCPAGTPIVQCPEDLLPLVPLTGGDAECCDVTVVNSDNPQCNQCTNSDSSPYSIACCVACSNVDS